MRAIHGNHWNAHIRYFGSVPVHSEPRTRGRHQGQPETVHWNRRMQSLARGLEITDNVEALIIRIGFWGFLHIVIV